MSGAGQTTAEQASIFTAKINARSAAVSSAPNIRPIKIPFNIIRNGKD